MLAASEGHASVVTLLLNAKADVKLADHVSHHSTENACSDALLVLITIYCTCIMCSRYDINIVLLSHIIWYLVFDSTSSQNENRTVSQHLRWQQTRVMHQWWHYLRRARNAFYVKTRWYESHCEDRKGDDSLQYFDLGYLTCLICLITG